MAATSSPSTSALSQQRSIAKAGLVTKILARWNGIQTLVTCLVALLTFPFRSAASRPPTLFRSVIYAATRQVTDSNSVVQMHMRDPPSDVVYEELCAKFGLVPETITLADGTRANWIGSSKAKKIWVNFHGGGYVLPLSKPMMTFLYKVYQTLQSEGKDVAILILSYDLAPEAIYPRQLQQAAMLMDHLLTVLHRSPRDIIMSGDSAGGNLVLSLVSHILHPHPDTSIPRINLDSKFRGLVLISPWTHFSTEFASATYNAYKDLISATTGRKWSSAFLGEPYPHKTRIDNYNQACTAPFEWWNNLPIDDVLITAGKDEVLVDTITLFADRLSQTKKEVRFLATANEAHDMPNLDFEYGFTEPGEQAREIRKWLAERF